MYINNYLKDIWKTAMQKKVQIYYSYLFEAAESYHVVPFCYLKFSCFGDEKSDLV
jgi:hypothetical protein